MSVEVLIKYDGVAKVSEEVFEDMQHLIEYVMKVNAVRQANGNAIVSWFEFVNARDQEEFDAAEEHRKEHLQQCV